MYFSLWVIAAAILMSCGPTRAQPAPQNLDEKTARRLVLPSVRATTDCLARYVASDARLTPSTDLVGVDIIVRSKLELCKSEISNMVLLHDQYFYAGKGLEFFRGAYLADLPRAVMTRIKPELDRQRAAAAQAEAAKAARISTLEKSRDLLRDKAYECAETALRELLAANETADVMTTAAMTMCRKEYQNFKNGLLEIARERGIASIEIEKSVDTLVNTTVRENVLTMAVRLKAEGKTVSTAPPVNPSPAAAETNSLKKCLATVADVQKDKQAGPKEKTDSMLRLCRPEIETLARSRFLNDPKSELENARAEALNFALDQAKVLVGDPNPSH